MRLRLRGIGESSSCGSQPAREMAQPASREIVAVRVAAIIAGVTFGLCVLPIAGYFGFLLPGWLLTRKQAHRVEFCAATRGPI